MRHDNRVRVCRTSYARRRAEDSRVTLSLGLNSRNFLFRQFLGTLRNARVRWRAMRPRDRKELERIDASSARSRLSLLRKP